MQESISLKKFREKWVGKVVLFGQTEGTVVGVCDDGSQCGYDNQRRAKPAGMLIVKHHLAERGAYWHHDKVVVVSSA